MLDVLLKLFALDQLFAADVEYEGAIGRAQHAVDLVEPMLLYSAASLIVRFIFK